MIGSKIILNRAWRIRRKSIVQMSSLDWNQAINCIWIEVLIEMIQVSLKIYRKHFLICKSKKLVIQILVSYHQKEQLVKGWSELLTKKFAKSNIHTIDVHMTLQRLLMKMKTAYHNKVIKMLTFMDFKNIPTILKT